MAAVNPESGKVVYSDYRRHHANQMESVKNVLKQLEQRFSSLRMRLALTGSGARPVAQRLRVPFVQEVAANAAALKRKYENVGCAIELGGQDAKMIFFRRDEKTDTLQVADMRMNGSCAGGTGAFIDEIASVLKVPVEEFNALAAKGSCVTIFQADAEYTPRRISSLF